MKLLPSILFCFQLANLKAQKLDNFKKGDTLTLYSYTGNISCTQYDKLIIVKENNTFLCSYFKLVHCEPEPDIRGEIPTKKSKILTKIDSTNIAEYIDDFSYTFKSNRFLKKPSSGPSNFFGIKNKSIYLGFYDCTKNKEWKEFEILINNIFSL